MALGMGCMFVASSEYSCVGEGAMNMFQSSEKNSYANDFPACFAKVCQEFVYLQHCSVHAWYNYSDTSYSSVAVHMYTGSNVLSIIHRQLFCHKTHDDKALRVNTSCNMLPQRSEPKVALVSKCGI